MAALVLAHVARRGVRRWVTRVTARGLAKGGGPARELRAQLRATTLGDVTADVVTVAIWLIAIFTALGQVGVRLGPLLAGAGIVGAALGFGAQSLVKDFLSGFFILLEDQFGIGDVVKVTDQVSGAVEDVSLRVTRLRAMDGTVWFVPNGEIRYLGNLSKEWSRALVDFDVAYGEDVDEVIDVIRDVADRLRTDPEIGPKILEDVEILGVEQLAESSVKLRTYMKTLPLEQWTVMRRFRKDVKAAFDARGIEIPLPHRKLILESSSEGRADSGREAPEHGEGAPERRSKTGAPRGDLR